MKVVEKFISINGESIRAGELAVFIRFKGCNLSCSYCDTAWANENSCDFDEMKPEEIADYVAKTGVKNVTLTGGEPMLQPELEKLVELLLDIPSVNVEIETNGSKDIGRLYFAATSEKKESDNPVSDKCENGSRLHFTLDYKSPSSGCEESMRLSNYEYLGMDDAVKFVVGSMDDLKRAKNVIDENALTEKCKVFLSPVFGKIDPEKMVEFMIENKMNNVKLQLQMHKVIWDPNKRGV